MAVGSLPLLTGVCTACTSLRFFWQFGFSAALLIFQCTSNSRSQADWWSAAVNHPNVNTCVYCVLCVCAVLCVVCCVWCGVCCVVCAVCCVCVFVCCVFVCVCVCVSVCCVALCRVVLVLPCHDESDHKRSTRRTASGLTNIPCFGLQRK